jgi:hypothetical protein
MIHTYAYKKVLMRVSRFRMLERNVIGLRIIIRSQEDNSLIRLI